MTVCIFSRLVLVCQEKKCCTRAGFLFSFSPLKKKCACVLYFPVVTFSFPFFHECFMLCFCLSFHLWGCRLKDRGRGAKAKRFCINVVILLSGNFLPRYSSFSLFISRSSVAEWFIMPSLERDEPKRGCSNPQYCHVTS